jgi:uncharacterized membrane protein YgcG
MSLLTTRSAVFVVALAATLVLAAAGTAEAQFTPSCNPATISGTAKDGSTVTATRGSCAGVPPVGTRTLQWFKCDAALANCTSRTGQSQAASLAYTAKPADVNGRLVVQQVSTGSLPPNEQDLDNTATGVVAAIPPGASPVIAGTARVGAHLTGSEGFLSGTSPSVIGRQWLRCASTGGSCAPIGGATGSAYDLTSDDAGKTIRFRVTVQGPQQTVDETSAPTGVVQRASEGGGGGGGGGGSGGGGSGGGGGGGGGGSGGGSPGNPTGFRLLRPFPTIVVAGRVFRVGVVVSTFVVRGPKGARVGVKCRGRGCPVRRQRLTIRGRRLRLRRFERSIPAGTVIEIRVTKPRRIGKFTRLRIRSGRAPARTDLCVTPVRKGPIRCPGGVG